MVPCTCLFIFDAGLRRLASNNFRNSSYKEKTADSACVYRLSFRFLWLCSVLLERITRNEKNVIRNKKRRTNKLSDALVMLKQVFLTQSLQITTPSVPTCAGHRLILIGISSQSYDSKFLVKIKHVNTTNKLIAAKLFEPAPLKLDNKIFLPTKKPPSISFSPVTSTKVGMSPYNFLTFSFNHFATLVWHLKVIPSTNPKLLNLNRNCASKKLFFLVKSL